MTHNKIPTFFSFGAGVDSTAILALIALGEYEKPDYIIWADTGYEHEETVNHAFWALEQATNMGITVLAACDYTTRKVSKKKDGNKIIHIPAYAASGMIGRQCTKWWKVMVVRRLIRQMLKQIGAKQAVMLLGIEFSEAGRIRNSDVNYIENVYPLVEKRMRRADCVKAIQRAGWKVPPKSFCVMCPYGWKSFVNLTGRDKEKAIEHDEWIRTLNPHVWVHPARKPLRIILNQPEEQLAMFPEADRACSTYGYCEA